MLDFCPVGFSNSVAIVWTSRLSFHVALVRILLESGPQVEEGCDGHPADAPYGCEVAPSVDVVAIQVSTQLLVDNTSKDRHCYQEANECTEQQPTDSQVQSGVPLTGAAQMDAAEDEGTQQDDDAQRHQNLTDLVPCRQGVFPGEIVFEEPDTVIAALADSP